MSIKPNYITEDYKAIGSGNCLQFSLCKRTDIDHFYISAKIYKDGNWDHIPGSAHGFGADEKTARRIIEELVLGDWNKNLFLYLDKTDKEYLETKERQLQENNGQK